MSTITPLKLTQSGLKWLKIDVANTYGNDKDTFQEQVAFVDSNIDTLEALADEADSPYEYMNAVKALRDHQAGKEVKHFMYVDCSNQALQLYGVLTRDFDSAYVCNLSSGNVRTDAYGMLADAMNTELNTDLFTRKNCKKSMMVTLYGKQNAQLDILDEIGMSEAELGDRLNISTPDFMKTAFDNAMNSIASGAMIAMSSIQDLNDENIDTYYWVMPDGFKVKYDVKRTIEYNGTIRSRGGVDISFTAETEIYGATKYNAGMAPNLIHTVDGYVARELIRRMGDRFITTIHDAFGMHPNDVDFFINLYKEIMIKILNSNLLEDIMTQIANGRLFAKAAMKNTLTEEHINKAEYSVC